MALSLRERIDNLKMLKRREVVLLYSRLYYRKERARKCKDWGAYDRLLRQIQPYWYVLNGNELTLATKINGELAEDERLPKYVKDKG